MAQTAKDGKFDKLIEMIDGIDVAMMTSIDQGHLRSRPMWTLKDPDFAGTLYFFTRLSSHKIEELQSNPQVGLSYGNPSKQDYVSVSGHARLSRDPERMRRLWAEPMRTWFPEGLDDPDLGLLAVEIEMAEYWDSPSSAMVHLYGYAKAAITGQSPKPGDHGKLNMPH
ncbi:pyridoxamine 5'-phosphate oxidase family protein [Indioceanicola profundi]|uniref:pyridoxamine 5'-phosphate oxidase family protein n=1 Tax=Indioceanicola profundi TaxID=2220096 RepID=UPI000E6AD7FB|nr:pyridoxamine 5'-phosphate oxidase family protein [Indioceanicola profundi]